MYVQGVFCKGGNCPVGICPVGICPVGICPGVFVLESFSDNLTKFLKVL